MNRICPNVIECPCDDSPVMNTSAEAPDTLVYAGIYFPPADPGCLGCDPATVYHSQNCYGVVYSADSQAAANLLARSTGAICKDPRAQQFTNDPQTASCQCPGGSVFSYTVPAGYMAVASDPDPAAWIAAANAAALAYAEQQVANLETRDCAMTTSLLPHPGWMCLGEELLPGATNTYTITGLNAAGDWTFQIFGGALPAGVTLDKTSNNTAQISGTPTDPGVYTYTILAFRPAVPGTTILTTDTLRVFGITNPDLPDAAVATPYLDGIDPVVILTAGGTDPVVFSVDPSVLPVWMAIADDGTITGTPGLADVGFKNFDVTITDPEGRVCTQTVTINVLPFFCVSTPPHGKVAVAYSYQLLTTFGVGPWTFIITAGATPAGLNMDAAGLISGTPTISGNLTFQVQVTDSLLHNCTGLVDMTIDPNASFVLGPWVKTSAGGTVVSSGNPATFSDAGFLFQAKADLVVTGFLNYHINTGGTNTFDAFSLIDWFNYGNSANGNVPFDTPIINFPAGHYQLTFNGGLNGGITFTMIQDP